MTVEWAQARDRFRQVAENSIAEQTILAVFPDGKDRTALQQVFGRADYRLLFASTFQEAKSTLRGCAVTVVISESQLPDGFTWKDLLAELQRMGDPPPLVLADRLADDRLWAEVLNLGAYDLLTKPFDSSEVFRTVSMACGRKNDIREPANSQTKPLQSGSAGLA